MNNNQRGFGLVETLISVAVVSVITYAVVNQAELAGKIRGKGEFSERVSEITTSIKVALGDTQTCSSFVNGVTIGEFQTSSGNPGSTVVYNPGSGVAIGGEIVGRNLSSPFQTITNPGNGGVSPTNNLEIPKPLLVWDPSTSHYKKIDGVLIKNVQIVSDGYRLLLRLTFEKPSLLYVVNLGGAIITKDLILRGNRDTTQTTIMDCESDFKISVEEFCLNSNGTVWENNADTRCIFPGIIKKTPPPTRTQPIYLLDGKLVSSKFVVSSTARCLCPVSNCTCTCSPVCPAGSLAEVPPRFVVNSARLLFPVIQINGPQKCGYERNCYSRQPIPTGLEPVGKLVR